MPVPELRSFAHVSRRTTHTRMPTAAPTVLTCGTVTVRPPSMADPAYPNKFLLDLQIRLHRPITAKPSGGRRHFLPLCTEHSTRPRDSRYPGHPLASSYFPSCLPSQIRMGRSCASLYQWCPIVSGRRGVSTRVQKDPRHRHSDDALDREHHPHLTPHHDSSGSSSPRHRRCYSTRRKRRKAVGVL